MPNGMTLIWDFDGTLYDTYPQMAHTLAEVIQKLHHEVDEAEAYRLIKRTVYAGVSVYAERFSLSAAALYAAFRERQDHASHFPLMAGAADCLRTTHAAGYRHMLYTHRNHTAVERLQADGLAELFTDFITREDPFPEKPAPDALLHLMRKHGFTADEAIMIGDRDIDMQAADNVGMSGILYDPGTFYPELTTPFRVETFEALTQHLLLGAPLREPSTPCWPRDHSSV